MGGLPPCGGSHYKQQFRSATANRRRGHEREKAMSIDNEFVLDVVSYTDWDDEDATPYGCFIYSTP